MIDPMAPVETPSFDAAPSTSPRAPLAVEPNLVNLSGGGGSTFEVDFDSASAEVFDWVMAVLNWPLSAFRRTSTLFSSAMLAHLLLGVDLHAGVLANDRPEPAILGGAALTHVCG